MLGPGDVLAAVRDAAGRGAPTRAGSDQSLVVVGYLVSEPDSDNLCEVSVLDSEPIAGVPAVPSTYTSVTTVYVLMRDGRPVQVLGPASTAVTPGTAPSASTSSTRVVRGRVVTPLWSGTYRVTASAWDRWNVDTYGGRSDVYQYGSTPSGTLYGLATYGDQITDLGWDTITRATLTLVSNGAGFSSSWTATVRGCASGTRPAGAPTFIGNTATVTVPGYGKPGQAVSVDLDATMCDDLRDGTIRSLGLTGTTYGGTYGTARPPGWVLTLDGTVAD